MNFGIEEEYMFSDYALRAQPTPSSVEDELRLAVKEQSVIDREFMTSQLEYSSPIFSSVSQAALAVTQFRTQLLEVSQGSFRLPMSTGTPFQFASETPQVTMDERYQNMAHRGRQVANDYHVNGLHVHVEIPDDESGVKALNSIRPWLPFLLSLSGNSPYWDGKDTGFASWRTILARQWTTFGCPPSFIDATDYHDQTSQLVGLGITADLGSLAWSLRLSAHQPTLEFRVFDAQLSAEMTVFLALICRALVKVALHDPDAIGRENPSESALNAALWHSAREGTSGTTFQPHAQRLETPASVFDFLLPRLADAISEDGDLSFINFIADRISELGNGAEAQRRAFYRSSIQELRKYLVSQFISPVRN